MKINIAKTFNQIFTLACRYRNIDLKISEEQIYQQENKKYLGMPLDWKITWQPHSQCSVKKTSA
jgi:hypothetical protein